MTFMTVLSATVMTYSSLLASVNFCRKSPYFPLPENDLFGQEGILLVQNPILEGLSEFNRGVICYVVFTYINKPTPFLDF